LRRRNAVAVVYLILTFVMLAFIPFLQESSLLRAYMLVIFGAAFMFLTVGVVTYSIIFPEIMLEKDQNFDPEKGFPASFEGVMKVLREDERKVCMAIWEEGGTALQKDVKWATKLSKVQTHRAVARLANRGVITVSKDGRRNRLSLASWLYKNTKDKNS
jgi:predicted membrane channel-forming protein YqfA (hemolysin III family)